MHKTRKLLSRPAGNVDAGRTDAKNKSDPDGTDCGRRDSLKAPLSPLKCGDDHGDRRKDHSSDKKWSQKLVESKVFKRLMRPANMVGVADGRRRSTSRGTKEGSVQGSDSDGVNGDYDAPRLGEVPVRSKYYRPDQEKSHFANHPTYLPLAEQCGPPQPSSFTSLTPWQGRQQKREQGNNDGSKIRVAVHSRMSNEAEVGDACEQAPRMLQESHYGSPHISSLCEGVVMGIEGSRHSIRTTSVRSNASCASSVGPTGLALMPQFRWIPKQGGGGIGFNPFMKFRCQLQPVSEALTLPATATSAPTPSSEAQQSGIYQTTELPCGTTSPEQQPQSEIRLLVPGRHNSYLMRSISPSTPPMQQSAPPSHPRRETGDLSFYGPIGSIGIETSRKRRAVERQSGTDGAVERDYKERSSCRGAAREDTDIPLLTQLWCDVSLLRAARVVDSPRLPSDDGEDYDAARGGSPSMSDANSISDDGEVDEVAMNAREEKRRQRRRCEQHRQPQYPARSPSFYFRDGDLASLRVEDTGEGSPSTVDPQAAAARKPAAVSDQQHQRKKSSAGQAASPAVPAGGEKAIGGIIKASTRAVAVPEVASSSSSSRSSGNGSSDDDSNSNGSSTGERSATFALDDDDGESVDSGDANIPRRHDAKAVGGDFAHQRSREKRSSMRISAGMGRSMLGDGHYDFMDSSVMDASLASRVLGSGGGRRISLLHTRHERNDDGEVAAAVADRKPNCTPYRAKARSAAMSAMSMAPQRTEHLGTPTPVARGSAVGRGGEGAAAALPRRGQRRVNNATDTRAPSTSAARLAPHCEYDAGASSDHSDGVRPAGDGLGEQFVYGSSFSMCSRRNSYSATACDEAPDAASMSLGVCDGDMRDRHTTHPDTSVAVGGGEASVTMGVSSGSRSNTVSPGAFGVMSRGPTTFPSVGGGFAAQVRGTASHLLTLPPIDRGSIASAACSRPPSTAQSLRLPAASTSPYQHTRRGKMACPDGCLAPITSPITPTAGPTPKQRGPQSSNSVVSIPVLRSFTNASATSGLGDIVGGKSYPSLAFELPGI
ncbi:hypothetical protein LSCM1_06447 [Leishmania martiniquensis]|uniref:Uncharacterized protein n=1 Tax=Leishmania martiniquensis TaxID=1580590 RepID=A0A836HL82_9TRYP|nr:hypothetical protein LSCM1_06447 [Leishmania martiniquensis]